MSVSRVLDLPGSAIQINIEGFDGKKCLISESDVDFFQERFFNVWATIPESDRRSIETHWQQFSPHTFRVELQGDWWGDSRAIGSEERRQLNFRWEICGFKMDDDSLEALIAHEMAHVFQRSIGFVGKTKDELCGTIAFPAPKFSGSPLRQDAIIEHHADETVLRWGYDWVKPWAFMRRFYDHTVDGFVRLKKSRKPDPSYKKAMHARLENRYDCEVGLEAMRKHFQQLSRDARSPRPSMDEASL